MESLPETRNAILQLLSDERMRSGVHLADYVSVGVPGVSVGEVPFDPQLHSVASIDPMSINESAYGMPHVRQVVPFKSLEMSVILHKDIADRQIPRWLSPARTYKQELALGIAGAVYDAKQFGDEANYYIIGDTQEKSNDIWNAEYIEGTEDPDNAARAIEDICLRGLTFVVSDFNRLPLEANYGVARSIAIKSNHPFELEVLKGKSPLPIGGAREVRTWKSKELSQYNADLQAKNDEICARLGSLGMEVVQATSSFENGVIDMNTADSSIATSLRKLQ